ncbi:MAG TPA: SMP-30/gluconolactonase/LRE family protein [Chitinophagaceae bacterium]|nr:SMP-30/gluconolactonase/LRE family protein [Chitinophagaceae bacterium]
MKKILLYISIVACMQASAQVSTIAGKGLPGYVEGTGSTAQFKHPNGVAVDASGNIYVGDLLNHVIRKITPAGVVSTYAGTGTLGYMDGPVATAQFNEPWGLAIDASGNMYVGDAKNNLIRKITPAGIVSTLAGSGIPDFADGTGAFASFNYPSAVGVDAAGNVYVGDCNNQRVRKITPAGVVTTIAGTAIHGYTDGPAATAQFHTPNCMAVSPSGDVYISDMENAVIRKISGGMVSTFAGSVPGYADGKGTAAKFFQPHGIVMDNLGNLFVSDFGNNRIRKITQDGTVSTIAGTIPGFMDGATSVAQLNGPKGIAKDKSGNLYVADENNHSIRKLTGFVTSLNPYQLAPSALYPNPAKTAVTLKCQVQEPRAHIAVYNAGGQLVLERTVVASDYTLDETIDISNLAQGHYWIKVTSGNTIQSSRFAKYQ